MTANTSEKLCTLYIVRHGETEWNTSGIVQGHSDSPLTVAGVVQAQALGERFKHISFAAAFSSDLPRAVATTTYALQQKKIAFLTTQSLRERRYGAFEGKHVDELRREIDMLVQKAGGDAFRRTANASFLDAHNIESSEEMIARVITFLREIAVAYPKEQVLVVTHGGVLRELIVHLGSMPHEALRGGKIGNTAHVVLLSDGVDFFVREVYGINP